MAVEQGGKAMKREKKMRQEAAEKPMEAALEMTDWKAPKTDPMGSYTGVPQSPYEKPVQDADDL
jgi:hypothetical protein